MTWFMPYECMCDGVSDIGVNVVIDDVEIGSNISKPSMWLIWKEEKVLINLAETTKFVI